MRQEVEKSAMAAQALGTLAAEPEWAKVEAAFQGVAEHIDESMADARIAELLLAPDGVVRAAYPPDGPGVSSIGLDLWDYPISRDSVRFAHATRKTVVYGPYTFLSRGGRTGLIFRYPTWADEVPPPGMLVDADGRGSWTGVRYWDFEPPAAPGRPRKVFWGICLAVVWWDILAAELVALLNVDREG